MRRCLPLILGWLAACGGAKPEAPLSIAAAASLRELVQAAVAPFHRQEGGPEPVLVFEASSTLARQISEGGAIHVFLSADRENVQRAGPRVPKDQAFVFLANELVLAVRRSDPSAPADLAAFAAAGGILGLAGEEVPAGRYARSYLESLGLLDDFEGRIAIGNNVRATLALLQSGAVSAAFVYRTDAALAGADLQVVHAAPRDAVPVVYLAAPVRTLSGDDQHPKARRFLEFLASEEFLDQAAQMGFVRPQ